MRAAVFVFLAFSTIIVTITGFWGWISNNIFPSQTWGLYSRSFFEDILANAHGTIIDLFVVGLIIYWFEQRRNERDETERTRRLREDKARRNREDLADLRYDRSTDAPYKVLGTIRRLLDLEEKNLKLSEINLSKLEIRDLKLEHSDLHATIFKDSRLLRVSIDNCRCEAAIFIDAQLEHTTFSKTDLRRAKFQNAMLKGMDFTSCDVAHADFSGADLSSANFRGVDCKGVKFTNAILRSTNFIDAKNLDPYVVELEKLPRGPKVTPYKVP